MHAYRQQARLLAAIGVIWISANSAWCEPTSVPSSELDRLSQEAARNRATCGPRALSFALRRLGYPADADDLIAKAQPGPLGTPIGRLLGIAREFSPSAAAIQSDPSRLTQLPIPSVLIVDKGSHCVVYDALDERAATATIFEPESGQRQVVTLQRLRRAWTGQAIVFQPPYPSRLGFAALAGLIAVVIASPAAYLVFRRTTVATTNA